MELNISKKAVWLAAAAIIIAIAIAYEPVRHNDFVNFDDPVYVKNNFHINNGLTLKTILWSFSFNGYEANWHPLTWISHAIDCHLFGLNPKYHHLHNIILHTLTSILLFFFLNKTTTRFWESFAVGLIFAIHPLRVESVAWISERKDVLSGLFFILTLISYNFYKTKPSAPRYLLIILCYIMGLLSKPMLVTLPLVLILLDFWPLKSISTENKLIDIRLLIKSFIEKIPFFLLSMTSSIITYVVQNEAGAVKEFVLFSIKYRILNAFVSYVRYISKTFLPINLSPLYPHEGNDLSISFALLCIAILIIITIFAIIKIRSQPYIITGWCYFLCTLIPVLGIVQVGSQGYADRYTYLPSIGLLIMIVYTVSDFIKKIPHGKILGVCLLSFFIIFFISTTRSQVRKWKDSMTLFSHACNVTNNNFFMLSAYGETLLDSGQKEAALKLFEQAIDIYPKFIEAINLKARALLETNNPVQVIKFLDNYNDTSFFNTHTFNFLGLAFADVGDFNSAYIAYEKSIKLDPNNCKALNNLGLTLQQLNKPEQAIKSWQMVVEIEPNHLFANINLGFEYLKQKDFSKAINYFEKATSIDPNQTDVLAALAAAYASNGNFEKAKETAKKAIELAVSQNKIELADKIKIDLELYKQNKSLP